MTKIFFSARYIKILLKACWHCLSCVLGDLFVPRKVIENNRHVAMDRGSFFFFFLNFCLSGIPEYAAMLRLSEAKIILKNYPVLIIEKNIFYLYKSHWRKRLTLNLNYFFMKNPLISHVFRYSCSFYLNIKMVSEWNIERNAKP